MRQEALCALVLLGVWGSPARSDDCEVAEGPPPLRIVLDADEAEEEYSRSDRQRLREAGYELVLRAGPRQDMRVVRARLEAGETVRVIADGLSVSDLERLAKLKGTPVAVFHRERWQSDLRRIRAAGLPIEIRHADYSTYELCSIADE